MKNISTKTKILTGLLTGGLFLSSVSTTFAATSIPLTTDTNVTVKNECNQKDSKRQQSLDTNLKTLVTEKTLTQDQANKIKVVLTKANAARKANFEKTKSMTTEERKKFMTSNNINHINPLKSLVENGTITQVQADKVGHHGHHGHRGSRPIPDKKN